MNDPEVTMNNVLPNSNLIAYGSAKEVDCHLQLLVAARAVNRQQAIHAVELFDDVRAMTWRLLHPKR